jgi:hypothetical protein
MANASLIPKQLFGEDGMIKDIGEIAVPIIVSISKRTNSQRKVATVSIGLIMEDFKIAFNNAAAKNKIREGLQGLCSCDLIEIEDFASRKLKDAFDIRLYYELIPFVKLYDHEFDLITSCTQGDVFKLMMIYLYIVQHISERTKDPTWVSIENISAYFQIHENTVRKYIKILKDDVGVLFRKGKKKTPNGNIVHLHTRNMTEYIHKHSDDE